MSHSHLSTSPLMGDYNPTVLPNNSNRKKKPLKVRFCTCMCGLYDFVLKLYFICFGASVVYYLRLMNNKFDDLNDTIQFMGTMGHCLFTDVCHNSQLGRELCGTCYTNLTLKM